MDRWSIDYISKANENNKDIHKMYLNHDNNYWNKHQTSKFHNWLRPNFFDTDNLCYSLEGVGIRGYRAKIV